jgi:hypothetical protein
MDESTLGATKKNSSGQLPDDYPMLLFGDRVIRANKTGLLALIDAAASALAFSRKTTTEVFDTFGEAWDLSVEVCQTHEDLEANDKEFHVVKNNLKDADKQNTDNCSELKS